VTDPQAAIKAAAGRLQAGEADSQLRAAKGRRGAIPISAGRTWSRPTRPLQRPERLKDKAFFTEDEAVAELARVIGQDAEVDPRNVHYDWKEYGMTAAEPDPRACARPLIVDPPNGRFLR